MLYLIAMKEKQKKKSQTKKIFIQYKNAICMYMYFSFSFSSCIWTMCWNSQWSKKREQNFTLYIFFFCFWFSLFSKTLFTFFYRMISDNIKIYRYWDLYVYVIYKLQHFFCFYPVILILVEFTFCFSRFLLYVCVMCIGIHRIHFIPSFQRCYQSFFVLFPTSCNIPFVFIWIYIVTKFDNGEK